MLRDEIKDEGPRRALVRAVPFAAMSKQQGRGSSGGRQGGGRPVPGDEIRSSRRPPAVLERGPEPKAALAGHPHVKGTESREPGQKRAGRDLLRMISRTTALIFHQV